MSEYLINEYLIVSFYFGGMGIGLISIEVFCELYLKRLLSWKRFLLWVVADFFQLVIYWGIMFILVGITCAAYGSFIAGRYQIEFDEIPPLDFVFFWACGFAFAVFMWGVSLFDLVFRRPTSVAWAWHNPLYRFVRS